MRLIIEDHLVDDEGSTERIQLATIDRSSTTAPLGMSLAEGRALLAAAHAHCGDARLGLMGWHQRQIKTGFGLVNVQRPRVRHWRCAEKSTPTRFAIQADSRGLSCCNKLGTSSLTVG
jgi:hypothetical protein